MHIKQITISNFRSFRQQGEVQAFSPGTNTVVGRNGSGKSNLFDAVQFCLLAPKFAHLRQEERQALLHEGSGSAAVNAFVEIVFDNSDHRFQHENSDEVVLRRTIGLKKDEFFLQRKRTAKNEIQSLLEGAGFSKSNPYYVVQQGKVQDLCIMSDTARLRLLKEVAGTTVYDEKKSESLAKMEENNNSITKITDMLENIEERLQELNAEKDELNQYQQLDRSRRAAQYGLYSLELQKARSQLDSIEQDRAAHVDKVADLFSLQKVTHDKIRNVEALLQARGHALRRTRKNLLLLEEDKKQSVQNYTKLDLECQELQETVLAGEEQAESNLKLLERLEEEIATAQKELHDTVQPNYEQATSQLQEMHNEHESAQKQTEALYAKQGRGKMFKSKKERNAYLKTTSQELENAKQEKEIELQTQHDTLANLRRTMEKEAVDITKWKSELKEMTNTQTNLNKTMDEKSRQRITLNEQRREQWRTTEELHDKVKEAREQNQETKYEFRQSMPRATSMGLDALENKIVQEEGLVRGVQYFGMVMENFNLTNTKYRIAVEVAAQNSLFHIIVDTDETASRLMKRLEEDKLGRVTFLPLNQLRIETNVKYPENTNDIRPMIKTCIKYEKEVERAMEHIFNKKLVASSAEVASDWSTKLSMDAITLDGDLCSRKGALTGGFVDTSKSRLRAYAKQLDAAKTLQIVEREYQEINTKAQDVDQNIQNLMQELQRLEAKQAQLSHKLTSKETDITRAETRQENHGKLVENIEKSTIPPLERGIASLSEDIERLQEEMGTKLTQTLSDEDRDKLAELKELQESFATKIERQQEQVDAATLAKQKLESLLENNLLKRRQEILEGEGGEAGGNNNGGRGGQHRRRSPGGRLSTADVQAQRKVDLEERVGEREAAARTKDDLEARLKEARKNEEGLRKEMHTAKNERDQLRAQDTENLKEWNEAQQQSERFLTKRAMYTSKRENNMRKIQELGSLPPPDELKKYSGRSSSQLEKALDNINKKLKKYSHVNKKAYDQYVNFSETRERLLKRKEELDHGAEKVRSLIDSLDQKKDEAINRTFRGVSSHFKNVFKELVPNGAGELIMRTALDDESEEATDEEEESSEDGSAMMEAAAAASKKKQGKKGVNKNNPDVSLYRGIGIKVRFSEIGENFMMSQLSGGQKALVALGLIFAIQRCDPAPFYLFDELDQALDSTYRAAVANVIQRQANDKENPTQFIVSTFRQELVAVANRCYGISHQNKVSSLHHMPKKDAQAFISNLLNEEEAVGEVTSLAASKASRSTRESRKRKSAEEPKGGDDDDETDKDEASDVSGAAAMETED